MGLVSGRPTRFMPATAAQTAQATSIFLQILIKINLKSECHLSRSNTFHCGFFQQDLHNCTHTVTKFYLQQIEREIVKNFMPTSYRYLKNLALYNQQIPYNHCSLVGATDSQNVLALSKTGWPRTTVSPQIFHTG